MRPIRHTRPTPAPTSPARLGVRGTGVAALRVGAAAITSAIALGAAAPGAAAAGAPADWRIAAVALPASTQDRLVPKPGDTVAPYGTLGAFLRGDRGFVVWDRGVDEQRGASVASLSIAGRRLGPERQLPHPVNRAAAADGGRGVVLMEGDRLKGWQPGLWAARIGADGTPGRVQQLTPKDKWETSLAVNGRGDAVAAWLDDDMRVRAAIARAGRPFGRPITLGAGDRDLPQLGNLATAVSERGRILVVYGADLKTTDEQALAWVGSASNGRLGPVQPLGRVTTTYSELEFGAAVDAGFDALGRGYASWGGPKRQSPVSFATLAPGATRFGPAITVERGDRKGGTAFTYPGADLAVSPDRGGGVLGWRSPDDVPQLATIDARGRVARTQSLPGGFDAWPIAGPRGQLATVTSEFEKEPPALRTGRLGGRVGAPFPQPALFPGRTTGIDDRIDVDFDRSGRLRLRQFGLAGDGTPALAIATRRR